MTKLTGVLKVELRDPIKEFKRQFPLRPPKEKKYKLEPDFKKILSEIMNAGKGND